MVPALLLFSACAAQQSVFVRRAPEEVVSTRIYRALERAHGAVFDIGELLVAVRYNPARCDCPPWELRNGATWQRVELDFIADNEPDTPEAGTELVVRIIARGETVVSDTGWRYLTWLVE